MAQTERQSGTCPHLGTRHDPASFIAFPSQHNHCHTCTPTSPVKLEHQDTHCLSASHADCVVFNTTPATALPASLRLQKTEVPKKPNRMIGIIIVLTAISLFLGLTAKTDWQIFSTTAEKTPTPSDMTSSQAQIATGENTPLPTSVMVLIPVTGGTLTVSPTPLIASHFLLGSPLGRDNKYMIHTVLSGDSLSRIAEKYGSSIEAITASNYVLKSPIQAGMLIVIPIGVNDPTELPAFEPYQVTAQQATTEEISASTGVEKNLIEFHNNLEENQIIPNGAWILILRKPSPQP
jgi:hypothetical protein